MYIRYKTDSSGNPASEIYEVTSEGLVSTNPAGPSWSACWEDIEYNLYEAWLKFDADILTDEQAFPYLL